MKMNNSINKAVVMEHSEFDTIWEKVIWKKANSIMREFDGLIIHEEIDDEIYAYVEELCNYATNHYMEPHGNEPVVLNRYKIAAAYMIAILKARPLKKVDSRFYKEAHDLWIFNEELALYTGLSIIRSFLLEDANDESCDMKEAERKRIIALFAKRIPLLQDEKKQWERELYYLRHEGCYNLLALAHELEDYIKIIMYKDELREKGLTTIG